MMKKMVVRSLLVLALLAFGVSAWAAPITLATNVGCVGGGPVVCDIDSTMTYLLAAGPFNGSSFNPDGTNPLVIDLQTVGGLGLTTGSVVTFTALGDMCFNSGFSCSSPSFGAVFSSSASFDNNHLLQNRVPGALAAPGGTTPVNTTPDTTSNGGFVTDITQDFLIFQGSGLTITLPNIAVYRYLFVGILDRFYGDNTDGGTVADDLQLNISTTGGGGSPIPEPGTYALLLSGLGALVAFRRYRVN